MPPSIPAAPRFALSHFMQPRTFTNPLCRNACRELLITPSRTFNTSRIRRKAENSLDETERPRWSYTPERMRAPVSLNKHDPRNRWDVNESQEKLDAVYNLILGVGGDSLLTVEVKWLAVTHKSFEQGRRGYNDRLAFLGKRIFNLQTSLALLNQPESNVPLPPDVHERESFQHPSADLLSKLSEEIRLDMTSKNRVARVAENLGLMSVMRWKPRKAKDLVVSGSEQVLAQALYAIIGAVALQRGGEVATRIVRERILPQMGLK